jgi:hypothetical protein
MFAVAVGVVAAAARLTIVRWMTALALVLHLAIASPGLSASVDPGPFQGSELAASSLGVLVGDGLVLGSGYAALRLFANGTIEPSAGNFRTVAYSLVAAAVIVPPLTAALFARWARAEPASGATWKALLLATAGQVAALAVGYAASPRFWVIVPAQMIAVGVGTSLGLHWGPRRQLRPLPAELPDVRSEPEQLAPDSTAVRAPGLCADPALASRRTGR